MRLIFFFFLFFSSFVFANVQDEVSAAEVSAEQTPIDEFSDEVSGEVSAEKAPAEKRSVDEISAAEAKERRDAQTNTDLFENYFFFEDGGTLETRLALKKSPVYRVSASLFSLSDDSAIGEFTGSTVSAFAERDHSRFLLKEFSQVIYPWNFFINQFFFLHDIRFSIYVENTYLYSDMASSFYENFQNINVKPESVLYFRFRYIW